MRLIASTQRFAVHLAIEIIEVDDDGQHVVLFPLLSLAWLVMAIWSAWRIVNTARFYVQVMLQQDFLYLCEAVYCAASVIINSLAFGLGVRYAL